MEPLMRFEDLLLADLHELVSKGDLSPSEIEKGKIAVCTIKEIEEVLAMPNHNENPENSFDNYSERSGMNSYTRMRSPRTGRYVSNDSNSYNNNSYARSGRSYTSNSNSYNNSYDRMSSNHSNEDMILDLEMKMNQATNERERQTIQDMISILRNGR